MNVSVVMPAYKRRFLGEAIASVLAQTYADFEFVIVDDASPEGLGEVVRGVGDRRIRYFRNDGNIGGRDLCAAWERAISHAHGDWIVLAGDDDVYAPGYLQAMVALARAHPEVDLVRCRTRIIDGAGETIGLSAPRLERESALEMMYDRVMRRNAQFVPEFMFRRSRLADIGGFVKFPKAWYSDDATWIRMAGEKGCANSNETLFSFRMSGINISSGNAAVSELVEAGLRYRDWAREWISVAKAGNPDEAMMLDAMRRGLDARVSANVRQEMLHATKREWLRVMAQSRLPKRWKLRVLWDAARRLAVCA